MPMFAMQVARHVEHAVGIERKVDVPEGCGAELIRLVLPVEDQHWRVRGDQAQRGEPKPPGPREYDASKWGEHLNDVLQMTVRLWAAAWQHRNVALDSHLQALPLPV